ncbi:ras-specific guanine nucleotide-releasing factor RalGPS2 isoform X1 [Lates japonicus]|uniref:Ras-specific guanine nucleotide-releasing factor RalGPS2 isoform X1 n=1 Tax=Lates japonicus TaxID=270547 RepID=A0AAD3M2A3_LATJO|nr:ras-specific guanine nucleotide-releasing factor RalGPS2 isoform X1 [Lates japonicus]
MQQQPEKLQAVCVTVSARRRPSYDGDAVSRKISERIIFVHLERFGEREESRSRTPVCPKDRDKMDKSSVQVPTSNTYKYQAGNRMNALLWFKHLSAACQSNRQQVPANLMSFE